MVGGVKGCEQIPGNDLRWGGESIRRRGAGSGERVQDQERAAGSWEEHRVLWIWRGPPEVWGGQRDPGKGLKMQERGAGSQGGAWGLG